MEIKVGWEGTASFVAKEMVLGIELAVVLAFLLHLGKACANSLD